MRGMLLWGGYARQKTSGDIRLPSEPEFSPKILHDDRYLKRINNVTFPTSSHRSTFCNIYTLPIPGHKRNRSFCIRSTFYNISRIFNDDSTFHISGNRLNYQPRLCSLY